MEQNPQGEPNPADANPTGQTSGAASHTGATSGAADPSGQPAGASNPGAPGAVPPQQQGGDADQGGREGRTFTTSEAPNNSFETGAGEENTGFDSEAIGSIHLSNEEFHDLEKTRNNTSTTGETAEGIEPGDGTHEAE
jgi:hypothetical protein